MYKQENLFFMQKKKKVILHQAPGFTIITGGR